MKSQKDNIKILVEVAVVIRVAVIWQCNDDVDNNNNNNNDNDRLTD